MQTHSQQANPQVHAQQGSPQARPRIPQARSKQKNPRVAAALACVGGPVGFLYVGWRYALAASVLFLGILLLFSSLFFAPPWLKYVNLPLFGLMAYRTCEQLNTLEERRLHRAAGESNTIPVAVFAMTSMLPLLAVCNAAIFGVATALPQFVRGDIMGGLWMLVLVTPILVVLSFLFFLALATGIDRIVLNYAPAAPTYIFPPAIAIGGEG